MSEETIRNISVPEKVGAEDLAFEVGAVQRFFIGSENTGESKDAIVSPISWTALEGKARRSGSEVEYIKDEGTEGEDELREVTLGENGESSALSNDQNPKEREEYFVRGEEKGGADQPENEANPKRATEEKEDGEVETEREAKDYETFHETLLGSQTTGLEASRHVSPEQLKEKVLALVGEFNFETFQEKPKVPVKEEWSDDVWLQIAARQRALRRSRKPADIALRKQKYPELFRSDVSICPSYTDYKLPYFVVARQRHLRSLRIIQDQIKNDIEEMALLQPRALDGVRIVRTFCQGAPHHPLKDPLNSRDRRRLEYLLAGNIF